MNALTFQRGKYILIYWVCLERINIVTWHLCLHCSNIFKIVLNIDLQNPKISHCVINLAYSHETILELLVIKGASEEKHVMDLVREKKKREGFFSLWKSDRLDFFSPLQHRINKSSEVMNISRMTNINVSPVVTHASFIPQNAYLWLVCNY